MLPADGASPGRRADAGQRPHPRRVLDGDRLRDHAAHRHADEVRGLQTEVVEQRDGVAGQVGHRVRRPRATGREGAHQLVAADRRRDPGRPAGVAVVVAHDVEAGACQLLAERLVPPRHRAAQPHHQEQRLVVGVAEGLVAELDLVADRGAELVGRDGRLAAVSVGRGHVASEHDSRPQINAKWPTSPVGSGFWARFDDCDAAHNGRIPDSGGLLTALRGGGAARRVGPHRGRPLRRLGLRLARRATSYAAGRAPDAGGRAGAAGAGVPRR